MEDIDRRSALAFGLATAATLPALLTPTPASAQRYRPDEGREIAPGVRRVDLTKRASEIPAYATVSMRDIDSSCGRYVCVSRRAPPKTSASGRPASVAVGAATASCPPRGARSPASRHRPLRD